MAAQILTREAPEATVGASGDLGINWYQEVQIWDCDRKMAPVVCAWSWMVT